MKYFFSACLICLSLVGCQFGIPDQLPDTGVPKTMADLQVPPGFLFETSSQISYQILLQDVLEAGIPNVKVSAYDQPSTADGNLIGSAVSDASGIATLNLKVASSSQKIYLHVGYIGLVDWMEVPLDQESKVVRWGDQQLVYDSGQDSLSDSYPISGKRQATTFHYFGSYNSQGKPNYLTAQRDIISQDLLDLVNSSLPEGYPVPTYNPQYIADSTITDLRLKDSAEVYITFVHEGAGYRNALGYYTYDLANPPHFNF